MFHESRSSNCHLSATVSSGVHVAEMRSEMNENEEEKLQLRQRSEITENRVPECVLSEDDPAPSATCGVGYPWSHLGL